MDSRRVIVSLNGDWQFGYEEFAPEGDCPAPSFTEYEAAMPVPGYWDDHIDRISHTRFWSRDCKFNPDYRPVSAPMGSGKPADASLPYLYGTGWYRKSFFAEKGWEAKSIMLNVGGVTMEAWVWLNGSFIGRHVGHLTPFELDLTSALRPGQENDLVIAVSNTRTDRTGCSIRGYKGKSAGITRPVSLIISSKTRVDDFYVNGDSSLDKLFWQASIGGYDAGKPLWIDWEIMDPEDGSFLAKGTQAVNGPKAEWQTGTFQMEPWSDRNPRLYRLRLSLRGEGGALDLAERSFGLRVLRADGFQLLLNQSPVFLRGLTDHAYFPETCTVPTSYGYYERTIKILKSMGFNWIRFHTWAPPEECLEAADRLGMLLQVEAPNGFMEQDWLDILHTCRKHPSVIIYCCGNEVPLDGPIIDHLEKMSEHCKALAPDCLFSPMEGLQGVEYGLDESAPGYVPGPHPYNKDLLSRLNQFSDVYAPHGSIFSYHSLGADENVVRERLAMHDRPCQMHEMGINDSYLNLDLERRYENTRIGTDLFRLTREYLDRMGVLKNAALYYQNSCKWQREVIKYGMEQSRQSERISGYDLLGAIDCHWHRTGYAVGLLNEFYEPKAGLSLEEVVRYNGESVLLAQVGLKRNVTFGQRLDVSMKASLFSGSKATGGELHWRLADPLGRVYCKGSKAVTGLEDGRVADLGAIEILFPQLPSARHLKLQARLSCDDLEIENSWDFWAFPEAGEFEPKESVKIIDRLDEEALEYIEKGGRALLIGARPFPALRTTFQIMSGGRTLGNNATVVHEHPIMRDFPHEDYCGWQFHSMIEGGKAVVFNDLDLPFEPIVEVVSGYKLVRKQAALFDLKVGLGGLVVCALKMDTLDPGANFLKNSILKYISGDEFAPGVEISPKVLREMIASDEQLSVDFSTDEGYDDGGHVT